MLRSSSVSSRCGRSSSRRSGRSVGRAVRSAAPATVTVVPPGSPPCAGTHRKSRCRAAESARLRPSGVGWQRPDHPACSGAVPAGAYWPAWTRFGPRTTVRCRHHRSRKHYRAGYGPPLTRRPLRLARPWGLRRSLAREYRQNQARHHARCACRSGAGPDRWPVPVQRCLRPPGRVGRSESLRAPEAYDRSSSCSSTGCHRAALSA